MSVCLWVVNFFRFTFWAEECGWKYSTISQWRRHQVNVSDLVVMLLLFLLFGVYECDAMRSVVIVNWINTQLPRFCKARLSGDFFVKIC